MIAASIWIARSETPEWAYRWISMRETTPCVMHWLSPPIGKPTTVTRSCRLGRLGASVIGRVPFQKAASRMVSSARSQSRPIASTSATYLSAPPRFFTLTTV